MLKVMFFIQLGFQFWLKGALSNLWVLFYSLQIVCYLSIYSIKMPANAEIYIIEITKIIEFEFFNIENLIVEFIDPEFKLFDFILGSGQFDGNKIGEEFNKPSMLKDLRFVIMLVMLAVFTLLVIGIIGLFRKKGSKTRGFI